MTGDELRKLAGVRTHLRGTFYFAFEKDGQYLLYRQVDFGRNVKVLARRDIDAFVREAVRAVPRAGGGS